MNGAFGIDHPLLATHDIAALRDRLIAMGFTMTAIGKHPWGTSTSLAMFEGCLLEIMGVYDDSLIDALPAGAFRFGRHVHAHLQQREGVALTALHSTGSVRDAQRAAEAGFRVAGHLEFGRDVVLPDGSADRTKTTLALLPDDAFPRLSFFLCQQHRPELIYVREWLEHPNMVNGICGVTIVANAADQALLRPRFTRLYGAATEREGGLDFTTANGVLRLLERGAFCQGIAPLPDAVSAEDQPFIAGMEFTLSRPEALRQFLEASGTGFTERAGIITLNDPALTANTVFRFFPR